MPRQPLPGPEALRRAGIAVPALGPKDGIALLNANAFTSGSARCAPRCRSRPRGADRGGRAVARRLPRQPLAARPRAVALRPAPGQAEASATLRRLLAGSDLFEPGSARRVQDPLSFRCLAPVAGAALRALAARAARHRGRPQRRRRQSGRARRGRRDDLDGQFRHDGARARLRGPRACRLACRGYGGVPHRQADVAGHLGSAALPDAARRQPHRLRHGAEDRGGARGGNPPSRPAARRHDGAGRRRRRGLRADDAARRREDARHRAPPRAARGDRARRRGPGGGSAHRHPARRRHRPDPPLRARARRRARRRPADRERFRAPGGRDRGRRAARRPGGCGRRP